MKYNAKVWISDDTDHRFFGTGPYDLLKNVDSYGSLHQAAKSMGMSYTKALNTIKNCERSIGEPLLGRRIGGRSGGGSELTPKARELMRIYHDAVRRVEALLSELDEELKGYKL